MHITLYHDALIPPPRYGGTERVVYQLARALVSLGHRVTLIAQKGSLIPGVEMISCSDLAGPEDWQKKIPAKTDLLHLWNTPKILPPFPFLVTIEGNGQPGEQFHPNTVFVSKKHAENHGSTHFVYNGIDVSEYPCDEIREPFLVFLAKANWKVKNLKGAIQIAKAAGLPLKVMGNRNWPLGLQRIRPHLLRATSKLSSSFKKSESFSVQYLGMLGDIEKAQILRKARALLFPVRWHEPFGLALTEALASGCPVYGTPYGSLPEIVSSQVGFLDTDPLKLAEKIISQKISPETCRKHVLENFTHLEMAQSYLRYYHQILSDGTLGGSSQNQAQTPEWKPKFNPQDLLIWD